MKINKLLIALTTLSITGFSQTITIRDISTREPLEKAVIQDKNNKQVFTDAKGNADISALNKGDSILIFSFGYSSKKSFVTTDATIYLSSKSVNLDEIVLSAKRFISTGKMVSTSDKKASLNFNNVFSPINFANSGNVSGNLFFKKRSICSSISGFI